LPDSICSNRTREDILRVTLRNNRVSPSVNLTKIAEKLEGYTGSDIKEVCREAVVHISHERAHQIEKMDITSADVDNLFSDVREVSDADFQIAMKKLKASVDTLGREMSKVIEWNEKFGEYKKTNSRKSKLGFSMYI
jgi:ATPase family AAA domain-containing protein 1